MGKNDFMARQRAMQRGFFDAGLQCGRQQIIDMVSLVLRDQRMYIIMNTRTVTSVLVSICQIIWLVCTSNYLGYLFLRILFQTFDGIVVEIYANKKYGISLSRYTVFLKTVL